MNARLELVRPPVLSRLFAALLACALSAGVLGGVSGLFAREGVPFARMVAAHDCAGYASSN